MDLCICLIVLGNVVLLSFLTNVQKLDNHLCKFTSVASEIVEERTQYLITSYVSRSIVVTSFANFFSTTYAKSCKIQILSKMDPESFKTCITPLMNMIICEPLFRHSRTIDIEGS